MDLREKTIKEIKIWLEKTEEKTIVSNLHILKEDKRKGVQQLVQQWDRKLQKKEALKKLWQKMNQEEDLLKARGLNYIAGVDEVGRGPLAGPVVTAAVILPEDFNLLGLNDSKQLSQTVREQFSEIIKREALSFSIASLDAAEIDRLNIYQATLQSMEKAVHNLAIRPQFLLVDALKLNTEIPQKALVQGDAHSVSIAAASIIAKVYRDAYMTEQALLYPQYGFERNMGYATPEHIKALQNHGPTPLHRHSFISNFVSEKELV